RRGRTGRQRLVQRCPIAFSRAIAQLSEFLVRGEPEPIRDNARGDIFVLRARDLAFQSRTCAENEQGRSRSRSQATGGRTDAHRAFQSLLRAAAHIGYGADRAIELVTEATHLPGSHVSYGYLRLHPLWDPLRGDPRFEALVASLAPK